MAWRTVVVASAAKLRLENDQLCVIRDSAVSLPVEDIGVLMVESSQVTLTSPLLARLAECGVLVLVCGRNHLPVFVGLPYAGHSRLTGIHRMQLDTTLPFKKRCWQAVVRQKILNQSTCLRLTGSPQHARIAALAQRVTSGDGGNVEAHAAREYFGALYGPDFFRGEESPVNSALNYGYAVLRAAVARAFAVYGFILSQGIHHRSELNPFNLADDFIEPFRPVVDLVAARMAFDTKKLTPEHRLQLAGVLNLDVLVQDKRQSVLRASEICAASFNSACKAGDAALLRLPQLLETAEHQYE